MQTQIQKQTSSREPKERASLEKSRDERALAAPVDVFENKDEILIVADFPGVPSDALHVNLDGTQLTLEGRREGAPPLRRSFQVPNTIDPDAVAAKLTGGVLELRLPKRADVKPRRIEVKG